MDLSELVPYYYVYAEAGEIKVEVIGQGDILPLRLLLTPKNHWD